MDLAIDDDEPVPSLDFGDIQKKYEDRLGMRQAKASGDRFSSPELHLTMLLVEVGQNENGHTHSGELMRRVKDDVASLGGTAHYAPGMHIGYTGDVAIAVEETSALISDLSLSSIIVILAVACVIIVYYRWWRSVLVLVPPLVLAALYSFAVASLPPFGVTELNSNTAFLGSIIVGNGVNFGIILLARYVEERRAQKSVEESLVVAAWGARPGTLAAALAAGASYAALSITEFQGFRQFGMIGGIGMVMSWLTAQVLMPPLLGWVDRGVPIPARRAGGSRTPAGVVARVVTRIPAPIIALSVIVTGLAIWHVRQISSSSLEYDFSKLRRADTWVSGEGYWGRKMDTLLGTYLTPIVMLTDGPGETRAVVERLRKAAKEEPLSALISTIRSADDVLPRDQEAKLDEAKAIRHVITPRIRAEITPEQRKTLDRFLGQKDARPITAADLPSTFTAGMRERDGRIDRAVLVFPKPSHALWEGPAIEKFVTSLRDVATATGHRPARVAGSLPLSADILHGIRLDGPLASLIAFVGAASTVIFVFGFSSTTMLVLGSLVIGVLWLAASTVLLGVRINFANFIAFPITFGIGIDYAVNVMARYIQDGKRDVARAIRSTGGAVGLCSMTTIIGYSSLLLAENRALFLFGVVAVLGELACLTTAVVTLPAVLESFNRRGRGFPHSNLHSATGS
jgi:hypothetical protein